MARPIQPSLIPEIRPSTDLVRCGQESFGEAVSHGARPNVPGDAGHRCVGRRRHRNAEVRDPGAEADSVVTSSGATRYGALHGVLSEVEGGDSPAWTVAVSGGGEVPTSGAGGSRRVVPISGGGAFLTRSGSESQNCFLTS